MYYATNRNFPTINFRLLKQIQKFIGHNKDEPWQMTAFVGYGQPTEPRTHMATLLSCFQNRSSFSPISHPAIQHFLI